jgi:hypothetical protein
MQLKMSDMVDGLVGPSSSEEEMASPGLQYQEPLATPTTRMSMSELTAIANNESSAHRRPSQSSPMRGLRSISPQTPVGGSPHLLSKPTASYRLNAASPSFSPSRPIMADVYGGSAVQSTGNYGFGSYDLGLQSVDASVTFVPSPSLPWTGGFAQGTFTQAGRKDKG